jgi:hypothetical protein
MFNSLQELQIYLLNQNPHIQNQFDYRCYFQRSFGPRFLLINPFTSTLRTNI